MADDLQPRGIGLYMCLCLCVYGTGTQIVGYVVKKKKEKDAGAGGSNAWKLIGTRSPQDPQVRRGGGRGREGGGWSDWLGMMSWLLLAWGRTCNINY